MSAFFFLKQNLSMSACFMRYVICSNLESVFILPQEEIVDETDEYVDVHRKYVLSY